MAKLLNNNRRKVAFLLLLLLWVAPSLGQQSDAGVDLDPLMYESVLLPDPLKVNVASLQAAPAAQPSAPAAAVAPDPLCDLPDFAHDGSEDKKERDEAMTRKIAYGSTAGFSPADPRKLVLHPTDSAEVLRTEGDIFWIQQLSNDLYFSTWGDTLQTLWRRDYPGQSLCNLLLGQVTGPDFVIDLTHRRYGVEKPHFQVGWASLYHVLCEEGVRVYASGFLRNGGKMLRGVFVVHQPNGDYVHMLVITTTVDELFAPQNQRKPLRGDLFTNVPQQNILNLYE